MRMPERTLTENTTTTFCSTIDPELVLYMDEENSDEDMILYNSSSRVVTRREQVDAEKNDTTVNVTQESMTVNLEMLGQFLRNSYKGINSSLQRNSSQEESIKLTKTNWCSSRFTFFSQDTGLLKGQTLEDIATEKSPLTDLLAKENYWLDVTDPTESELKWLGKLFTIHPLTIEDIQGQELREKCESFRNYYFVSIQTIEIDDMETRCSKIKNLFNIYSIVMGTSILTIHYKQTHHPETVVRRFNEMKGHVEFTPDWINYAIMDAVVDDFILLGKKVETEAEIMDELVFDHNEADETDLLKRIGSARKVISNFLRVLKPKAYVVRSVQKRIETLKDKANGLEISLYLGDVQDHILTAIQSAAHYEKILSRAHANHLAQISIEITQSGNKLNEVVTKLSVIATIIVPLNLITGLWGMNVVVPGGEEPNLIWFLSIVGFMVVYFIITWMYFRSQKIV
ncbi:CorA metal ion transporter [Basidiobolus ranarum]|uniref:CorA metal ion transporter n=1 Tax=Basidiobolus ranarum TaxID=34480 RepID=A0ABR2X4V9_9FUNG